MLVLLPPSETKAIGGSDPVLDLRSLCFPELTATRDRMLEALVALAHDLPAARAALKVTATKDDEITANARLRTAPTRPAIERYTGVLYEALDVAGMSTTERARADTRLFISSALFGVVRATDRIPAYRLSAGSRLPGVGSLAALWRPHLVPALGSLEAPVLDLRSGAYAALAPLPSAVEVRVVTEHPDGTRTVVSHFNKATKGRLARLIATTRAEPTSAAQVARIARRAGMRVGVHGGRSLEIVT